jgi:hypothetical protein
VNKAHQRQTSRKKANGTLTRQRERTTANIIKRRERHVERHPRDSYGKDALMDAKRKV